MAENNDFNLVISDEENTNLVSNRTLQNTLSPPNNNQFVRRTSDKNRGDTASQNHMYSPQFTETFGSGSKADQMSFPAENYFSPKQNWDEGNVYASYEGISTESNQKGGFVKKSKRQQQSEEVYVADDDQYPERSQRREYTNAQGYQNEEDQQDNYGQEHERMIKTTSDRFEGDYGDFQEEGSQGYEDDERRVQSLRDSQLSGPVRYSKMSEEEAARAFENRKKELFSTYLKKPPAKKMNSKPSSPGGEMMRGNRSDVPLHDDSGKPGFVIFNNKDNKVPNQPPGSKSQGGDNQSGLLNVKKVPSSGKKKEALLSKQRKDSPSSRKAPQVNNPRQTPKSQKAPMTMTQTFGKHKEAQRVQKPNFNDNQRREQQKNRNEQYREYYARNIEEITETNESNYERQREGPPAELPEYNNVYFMNKMKNKNSEIINDIQSIDDEISQLENEVGLRASTPKTRNMHENNKVDERAYHSQPVARGRHQEESVQAQTQNQKGGYGDRNSWKRDPKRPNSQQRENSAEKNVQGYAIGNIQKISKDPDQEREKRQRINDLQNGEYRETESHRDPIKEHIYQSYAVLNEKGFEHHYDYLYERALIQKKNRDLLQDTSRNVKEHQEIVQCTFQPQVNNYTNPKRQDIITQTKNWQIEKEKQLQANEKHKIEKELKDCTFYPNGMLEKEERLMFNSNDFYKRNIEWMKRKEADDMRKQNELYKSMMSAPEKPKSQVSMSFSRIHESQIMEDKVSPSGRTTEAGRMFRDPSNKSFRSTKDKVERSNSAKRDNSQKRKEPLTNINNRPSSKNERHMSPKTEKPLKTQESATKNNKKNLSSLNLQSQIMESYAILDNLQHMLSAKEKEKHQKVVHQKENVDKKLKTIVAPKEIAKQPAPRGTQGKGTASMRPTASPHRSPRTSAKLSVRNPPYETKPPEEFVQSIIVRKNRYFIEEKPADKPQQKSSKERSRSIDNRKTKRVATPTKEYKLSDMRGGSYVATANQAKQRKESPFKSKQVTRNYETSASKSVYSDIKGSPWRSVLHSPQSEVFITGPSPRYDINNVTKGITSPNSQALEKKYLDLLNQVSRVTKQLDHFNVENASLQEDISVIQKRQMNSNLLYS